MIWSSISDILPELKEEVLINYRGQYHLAEYDPVKKIFITRFDIVFNPVEHSIQWMRLSKTEGTRSVV